MTTKVLAEMGEMPWAHSRLVRRVKQLYFPLLIVLTLLGIGVIGYRLYVGMKVTALTSYATWGMWVAFYIYFIGLSAGSFLLSTLIYVFGMRQYEKIGRLALLSAVFALGAGLLFIWMDLGHPWRFYEIFTRPGWSSVMKIESWLYLLYIGLCLGELWLLMRLDLARRAERTSGAWSRLYGVLSLGFRPPTAQEVRAHRERTMGWVKILGAIGVPVAIGVHGGTGAIFAVVKAKPYWFSGLFPIIFLVSALVSGAGLMTFLYAFFGRRDADYPKLLRGLANLMVTFVGIDLLLLIAELVVGYYGSIPDHVMVLDKILFGPYWYTFWVGQVGLVTLFPLLVVALPWTKRSPFWLGLGGLGIVIGIITVRLNLVIPAYLFPHLPGLGHAYVDSRLLYSYFPSLWEWLTSLGAISLVMLLFSGAFRWLPVFEDDSLEEVKEMIA